MDNINKFLTNFEDGESFEKLLKDKKISISFSDDEKRFKEIVEKFSNEILITNHDFVNDYVDKLDLFKKVFSIENEDFSEVFKIMKGMKNEKIVIGMGGGRVLDVAKMVSFQTGRDLVLIPTAPTHDGLVSKNSALLTNGIKRSYPTKFPKEIIVPKYLWESSGHLKNFGKLDIMGNIIALEDVSLAIERINFKPDEKYMKLSALAIKNVLNEKNLDDLARALFLSGFAMEKSSRYCSGSDHELEKILMPRLNHYFHGQLAGTGTLISSKVYEVYSERLPEGLFFPPKDLYSEIVEIMKKEGIIEDAVKPLIENKVCEWLKQASAVRPERYTLWNEIDSNTIDWEKIIGAVIDAGGV